MSDNRDAGLEVLRHIVSRPEPNLWTRYGSWAGAENYDEASSREVLAPLDPYLLYPEGDRRALWLPGWEDRSAWGFDPPLDAYFAQLWRNPGASGRDDPDIWIFGRGTFEGRAFAVTTTRGLAREIATATGAGLAEVGQRNARHRTRRRSAGQVMRRYGRKPGPGMRADSGERLCRRQPQRRPASSAGPGRPGRPPG